MIWEFIYNTSTNKSRPLLANERITPSTSFIWAKCSPLIGQTIWPNSLMWVKIHVQWLLAWVQVTFDLLVLLEYLWHTTTLWSVGVTIHVHAVVDTAEISWTCKTVAIFQNRNFKGLRKCHKEWYGCTWQPPSQDKWDSKHLGMRLAWGSLLPSPFLASYLPLGTWDSTRVRG